MALAWKKVSLLWVYLMLSVLLQLPLPWLLLVVVVVVVEVVEVVFIYTGCFPELRACAENLCALAWWLRMRCPVERKKAPRACVAAKPDGKPAGLFFIVLSLKPALEPKPLVVIWC